MQWLKHSERFFNCAAEMFERLPADEDVAHAAVAIHDYSGADGR
jgi:HD superfamily phosphodiesterase